MPTPRPAAASHLVKGKATVASLATGCPPGGSERGGLTHQPCRLGHLFAQNMRRTRPALASSRHSAVFVDSEEQLNGRH